jgi:quercetin dioxygenase-like cupin family protein
MFNFDDKNEWVDLGAGVSRKIMSYNDEMMVVRVRFEEGAIGAVHQHVHTQSTFVVQGKFEFSIGEEKRIIATGDTCLMPSNVLHGCVCLEKGELLDVFTPMREDFL